MKLYGSQLWYNATSNTDKVAVVMKAEAIDSFVELLEKADLNYFGYENGKKSKISINRSDLDIVKELVGKTVADAMRVEEITKPYTPPEMNVFGTIDYKYIPNKSKKYLSGETELEQKTLFRTAELLTRQGVKFSGRAYDNKVILTVDEKDLVKAEEIYSKVKENLNNLNSVIIEASRERIGYRLADVIENMIRVGFEEIQDYVDLVREISTFDDVDSFDYVSRLNPKFTVEQNYKILNYLKEIYKDGGFDYLQPSDTERELFKTEKEYELDVELRSYLSEHEFNESQENVIRDIFWKEQSISGIFGEIDESFLPGEIEKLYSMILAMREDGDTDKGMKKIKDFLDYHYSHIQYNNDRAFEKQADYTDAIFVDNENQRVRWMYFNPDSDSGGQYVTNEITYKELLLANEFTTTPEEFFDYLSQTAEQYLSDVGTDNFKEAQAEFYSVPTFTNCSEDTVKKLVDGALISDVKILGKAEVSSYLLDTLINDSSLQDIHRDDNDNFRSSVEQRIDEFIDKLQNNRERIPGYSRFDTNTFCSEYKHSTYSGRIKDEIVGMVSHDLNEAFSALESAKEKAQEIHLSQDKLEEKENVVTDSPDERKVSEKEDTSKLTEQSQDEFTAEEKTSDSNDISTEEAENDIVEADIAETSMENAIPTITITTVDVLASEHQLIEKNKTYTLAEFDSLVERLNSDWISNRQREIQDFGGIDEALVLGGDYQSNARTDFVINLPNGEKITESIDIGSSYGGLLDYMNTIEKYKNLIPVLEQAIDSELTGTVEMPKPEEYRNSSFADSEQAEEAVPVEEPPRSEEPPKHTEAVSNIGGNVDNSNVEEITLTETEQTNTEKEVKFVPKIDYRITDSHIGEGTPSERFSNNIIAIQTLKQIEAENRLATPEEQEKLAKYVGWGGLSNYFLEKHPKYSILKNLLTDEELANARASTLTAFYTPPVVMQSMYKALGNMGFSNGQILEPSCGIGNFLGTIPEDMKNSKIHAVELDSLSGRIARQLYQNVDIKITGFENTRFNDNSFDVAVGNVPFGEISVRDKQYDKYNWRIHNYFFAKSLDKVRPGGVVAFITSRYTLDSKDSSFREYLSERADMLGAIRLPNNTFSKAAGTEVVSDIIFLQKRETPLEITPDWVKTVENENGFTVNKYFVDHPNMVLGNLTETSSRFGRSDITVEPIEGAELFEQLNRAIGNIQGTIPERKPKERDIDVETPRAEGESVPEELRNFSYYVNGDGKVYFKENDEGTLWQKGANSKNYEDRAKAFIAVRDCTREVLNAMVRDCSDEELTALQNKLNTLYDSFYNKYGLVHSKFNKSLFSDDISYQLVASLESKYNEKELIAKSDLFTKRTIKPPELVTSVDTAQEALTVSLAEKGRVDLDFMSELYENDKETIISDLKGKIFPVPELSTEDEIVYQDSSEYLSGDIRQKIDNAKTAAESNPMLYSGNIKALEDVVPELLKAGDIDVKIGAAWIDPKYYQQFMYETFHTPSDNRADVKQSRWGRRKAKVELTYSEVGNSYHIENKSLDTSVFTTKTFGTKSSRANAYFIFENLLNLRDTKIYMTVDDGFGNERRVVDTEKTKIAANKAEKIKKAFKEWIFKDPERREALVKKYNDMYNSIRPREFDGSGLTFPGMNAEIQLRPHQKNAIAHALYGGNSLFAHSVGAGKTFEMIATAMEIKRLGLCSKSLMVVPNHLTEQIGDDFQKLYPNANVLVATKDDFTKQKRRYLVSRIATGDYDAVIIGHSQLGKIPLSKEKQAEYIQEEINELVSAIAEMKAVDERSFSVKDSEKRKDNLEKQLQKLQTEKDDVVTFEELGIDKIFVDEAHEFKNLYTPTKLNNVSGVSHTASQKASDLYMKCRYLDEKTGGRGVTFATGTPISNSVTELYTMQRYLQHDLLQSKNIAHFDQWITLFGEQVTDYQIDPTGKKYKPKTRIANYSNMTELMSMFKCTADIKTAEMMKLDVPDCKLIVENVPATELQQELVNELSDRADAVESGKVEPTVDNFLKITSDGRKVGLDPRLIDPNLEDNPETKLNRCVRNVLRIHKETAEDKLTQLIFCDLGVPNAKNKGSSEKSDSTETVSIAEQESFEDTGNFCIYEDIKKKLIEGGVLEKEIAFIHDAKTDKAKSELFEKCRKGEVRVLLGSTPKMGTGTNIQNKLVAMHDLDVPWRPSDLEQRRGRMVRQGNENKQVELYRYVTKGTFDAYSYQTLENKERYISQIYTGNQRTCQDVDQQSLSYAEIKTLCTGDERLKELMTLDNEVSNLSALKREYTNTVYEMQDKIKRFAEERTVLENSIAGIEKDIEICSSLPRDKETGGVAFKLAVGGITFTDKTEAAKALHTEFEKVLPKLSKGETVTIGAMHGFPVTVKFSSVSEEFRATVNGTAKYSIPFSEASHPTNIKRLCNVFDGMEKTLSDKKEKLDRIGFEVKEAEKILNTPFEREQELSDKTKRRNSLKNELQMEQKEKASRRTENKTYHFSVANLRRNAQKHREQNNGQEKSREREKAVIS